jgi:hypothetical protein
MGGYNYVESTQRIRARIDTTTGKLEKMGYHVIWIGSFEYIALPPKTYKLNTEIDFTSSGNADNYQTGYWAQAQDKGRFMFEDCQAGVVFKLDEFPCKTDLKLFIYAMFYKTKYKLQRQLEVYANGISIGEWSFSHDADKPQTHPDWTIPKNLTDKGLLRIKFITRCILNRNSSENKNSNQNRFGMQKLIIRSI